MTPEAIKQELLHYPGITVTETFWGGAFGIIARYDLPKLFYPADMDSRELQRILKRLNSNLKQTYSGCGYYASCSQLDVAYPNTVGFVLFADEEFYNDYVGNGLGRI